MDLQVTPKRRRRWKACCAMAAVIAFFGRPALGHEFWVLPDQFLRQAPSTVQLSLFVGELFLGEMVPFSAEYVTQFMAISAGGRAELTRLLPRQSAGGVSVPFTSKGTHVLAIDTHPNSVELPPDKFNEYLRNEGLDPVISMRRERKAELVAGRERYRRHIKTIISMGEHADDTALAKTGQTLEIVPLINPAAARAGTRLRFGVLFEGAPLRNALVKAWHRHNGKTSVVQARTQSDGNVEFGLPLGGTWMLSVVHMRPGSAPNDYDWESYWGNLTFALPG